MNGSRRTFSIPTLLSHRVIRLVGSCSIVRSRHRTLIFCRWATQWFFHDSTLKKYTLLVRETQWLMMWRRASPSARASTTLAMCRKPYMSSADNRLTAFRNRTTSRWRHLTWVLPKRRSLRIGSSSMHRSITAVWIDRNVVCFLSGNKSTIRKDNASNLTAMDHS